MGYKGEEIQTRPCTSCKQEIMFITTNLGKKHPVNPKPKMLWVAIDGRYYLKKCYESHFATCPHADKHRRRRR